MIIKTYLPKTKPLTSIIHSYYFLYVNQDKDRYVAFPNTLKSILIGIDTELRISNNTIISNPEKNVHTTLLLDTNTTNKFVFHCSSVMLQINFFDIGLCRFLQLPISTIASQKDASFFNQLQHIIAQHRKWTEASLLKNLETFLMSVFFKRDTTQLAKAIALLETSISIKKTAEEVNMTYQTLYRNFKAYVGITPSMYQRISRLRAVLVSDEHGRKAFYDESHMIREFKFFTGYTPNGYKKNIKETKSEFYHELR